MPFFLIKVNILHSHRRENLKSYILMLPYFQGNVLLSLALSNGPNTVNVSPHFHLRTETDPGSEILC
jgi:hypothetical protein